MTAVVNLTTAPPLPVIPEEWHGKKVVAFIAVLGRAGRRGRRAGAADSATLAEPIADLLGPMPYTVIQTLLDPLWVKGIHAYFKATNLASLDDALIDNLCALHLHGSGAAGEIHVHQMGGAVGRVPEDATAFPERSMPFVAQLRHRLARRRRRPTRTSRGPGPSIDAAPPSSTGRAYVNFLGDSTRAAGAYGPREVRGGWSALKREYDPTNVFRLNQNIEP